ncbi:hypothetical protein AVEN_41150-1 [Araneus ventricosus]|uniref:Uncharacterized protein n=1 Tax=Araneus ventricosus TaxID=182803 RepID=A0A4Y2MHQ5_ARAVE|nr:hypothetical protein AVEN_41150-1 [Araneus ventricosus]
MVTELPHVFNLVGMFFDNCLPLLLSRFHFSLFNVVDTLTPEFESVVNTFTIGEEGYTIVPIESCHYTQAILLRIERKGSLALERRVAVILTTNEFQALILPYFFLRFLIHSLTFF